MIRKPYSLTMGLFLLFFFLSGCIKKIPEAVIIEKPPLENPMIKILEALSSAESLQAKTSIRIDTVRMGEETSFILNGFLIYQKPDKLRLYGFHPLGMGLFDALCRNGEFFLLIPSQKMAFAGEVSQFGDLADKAGPIQVTSERKEGCSIPSRIWIDAVEKETRIGLRLKEVSVNSSLPEDSFQWVVPEGIKVRPLTKLLRSRILW